MSNCVMSLDMATYCSNKEQIKINVTMDKQISRTQDKIVAYVKIDTLQSKLDIERIQLCIVQDLWIQIPNGFYSKNFQRKYHKKNIPWNQFQKTGESEYSTTLHLDFAFSPEQASVEMDTIKNRYQFRVKAVPKGCRNGCCGTDADMRMHILLRNAIPQVNQQQFVIPVNDWNPQVMNLYTATISSEYQIPSEMNQMFVNENMDYPKE